MQKTTEPLFQLSQAGILRQGRWLVRDIDFTLNRGEIVTLIGPNGSGKSTTAKMALGILPPDAGKVQRMSSLRVGYVPQRVLVDWTLPLTVKKFMCLTAKLSAIEIEQALARTSIAHLINAELRVLSGGEFQRTLLARAIARKPDLLVLDEPVQGVDFSGEIELYQLISSIRDELGSGVLLISHDLHVVMVSTDKVLCLNGHICCRGHPDAVVENPAYRQLFGDKATSALAIYRHHHDHSHHLNGSVGGHTHTHKVPGDKHVG